MFVSLKKYNDLITFASRQQYRQHVVEAHNKALLSDIAFWKAQSAIYQARAERYEDQLKRENNGRFRQIPIVSMEALNG